VREDSPTGEALAGVGVLFALLPAILGTLWLFAHGLPMGLQGAQDLATVPLIGEALADAPLQVSLLGNWPGGNTWRLLLLGPVIGLVVGGMLAARGAPQNERWWQGALTAAPYVLVATLVAVLFRITAEISVSGLTLDLALGASPPWLLALLPVGGALGAIGGLLAGRGGVWAASPRLVFLATAVLSTILLVGSLPSALAIRPQGTPELLSSASPAWEQPEATSAPEETNASRTSPSPTPASADRREQEEAVEVKAQEEDAIDDTSQREEVTLTEREEIRAPETDVTPASRRPQWQTSDPEGSYYHPPKGPCLGQCTDAYGRNNADIQGEWMQMSPEEKAAERERNITARQGEG